LFCCSTVSTLCLKQNNRYGKVRLIYGMQSRPCRCTKKACLNRKRNEAGSRECLCDYCSSRVGTSLKNTLICPLDTRHTSDVDNGETLNKPVIELALRRKQFFSVKRMNSFEKTYGRVGRHGVRVSVCMSDYHTRNPRLNSSRYQNMFYTMIERYFWFLRPNFVVASLGIHRQRVC